MANQTSVNSRLPIKVILPKQGKERVVSGGGGDKVPLRPVDERFRAGLTSQIDAISKGLSPQFTKSGLAPVRVRLHRRAIAKSHRPESLFSSQTCPVIGAGGLGDLFIKATAAGLSALAKRIESDGTKEGIRAIATIDALEPVTPTFRLGGREAAEILERSPRSEKGFLTKVRLFDFDDDAKQAAVVGEFLEACAEQGLSVLPSPYRDKSFIFPVECQNAAEVRRLAGIVSVRSIREMPVVVSHRPPREIVSPLPVDLPIRSTDDDDVPVVVVVDSGVALDNAALASWVVGSESKVAPTYRNPSHGTFVAGLIAFPYQLNPDLFGVDPDPCGVFDLQVLPNSDPGHGEIEELTESAFVANLEAALRQHANRFKVWNLSLSTDSVCSLDEFSDLAVELDGLQEKYQVSFVIAAGNYAGSPLLDYPRSAAHVSLGRITSPGDAVLGITVGSISHNDSAGGVVAGTPSPFSRHGSGPNHVIKPDLVHHGGSCDLVGGVRQGVRSIVAGATGTDIGTSFATPLVARTLAQLYHRITPTPTPVFARALLTHNARDPRTEERVPDGEENFLGFGRPSTAPIVLGCSPSSATLVFEDALRPGFYLEWDDFPYPSSLMRDGRYFGEVWMTIAFAPARGAKWGTEYCETHIEANFGVYKNVFKRKAQKYVSKFHGLVPPEHKNPDQFYEEQQVQHLRKWAPVRTYHGKLKETGEKGNRWRLKVQLLTRHGVDVQSQRFSLIVTIADPNGTAPVYDEMAKIVRNRFQAEDLIVRNAQQIRLRS